jgi:hypothetical protein
LRPFSVDAVGDIEKPAHVHEPPPDTGLRQMMTWTFIALVVAVLFSLLAVHLVFRWFGSG